MDTKQCIKCNYIKSELYFYLKSVTKNGKTYKYRIGCCGACHSSYIAEKLGHPEPTSCKVKYLSIECDELSIKNRKLTTRSASYRRRAYDMNDSIIRGRLTAKSPELSYNDITPELIELKRKQLKLHRDVKNYKEKSN